jgi:hypothetical protein
MTEATTKLACVDCLDEGCDFVAEAESFGVAADLLLDHVRSHHALVIDKMSVDEQRVLAKSWAQHAVR